MKGLINRGWHSWHAYSTGCTQSLLSLSPLTCACSFRFFLLVPANISFVGVGEALMQPRILQVHERLPRSLFGAHKWCYVTLRMRMCSNYVDSRFSVNVRLHSTLVTYSYRFFEFFPLHLLSFSSLAFRLYLAQHAIQLDNLSRSWSTYIYPSFFFINCMLSFFYRLCFFFVFGFIHHLTGDLNLLLYKIMSWCCVTAATFLLFSPFRSLSPRHHSPQAAHLSPSSSSFDSFSLKLECNGISICSFATVSRLRSHENGTSNNNTQSLRFKTKFFAKFGCNLQTV